MREKFSRSHVRVCEKRASLESLCTSGSHRWVGSPQRRLRLAIHCAHNRNEMYPFDSFSLFHRPLPSAPGRTILFPSLEELLLSIEWDVRSRLVHSLSLSVSLWIAGTLSRLTACRVRWPRTPARNFVFSCTAVKMLIDNCVAPLAYRPYLSPRLLHLSVRTWPWWHPPPVSTRPCVSLRTYVYIPVQNRRSRSTDSLLVRF